MLYYQFKDSVDRLVSSIEGVLKYGSPDLDEKAPGRVVNVLNVFESKLITLKEVHQYLPDELPGHSNKNFGPVVDPKDIQQLLSLIFPLVNKLDNQFPLLSYFPVRFFRDKSLIIFEIMNLYCEWKSYFREDDGPVLLEPESFIKSPLVPADELLSKNKKSFDLLFKNLRHSAKQAQRDISNEFKKGCDEI